MRLGCRYIAPSPRSANTEKLMSGRNLKLSRKVLSGIPNRVSAFGFYANKISALSKFELQDNDIDISR